MTAIDVDPDEFEHIPPEAASTYAKVADAYGRRYYRSVAETVSARLAPGDRVLDVGTGPGNLPVELARHDPEIRIDAFDFTHELVRYGRERAAEADVDDRVSFFVADCYRIPIGSERYPFLTSTGVLHALERPADALTEWYRVLAPGGTAWVADPTILEPSDEVDVDLTERERKIFEAYGVRSEEPTPIPREEAERIAAATPFETVEIGTGEFGDRRLYLTRER